MSFPAKSYPPVLLRSSPPPLDPASKPGQESSSSRSSSLLSCAMPVLAAARPRQGLAAGAGQPVQQRLAQSGSGAGGSALLPASTRTQAQAAARGAKRRRDEDGLPADPVEAPGGKRAKTQQAAQAAAASGQAATAAASLATQEPLDDIEGVLSRCAIDLCDEWRPGSAVHTAGSYGAGRDSKALSCLCEKVLDEAMGSADPRRCVKRHLERFWTLLQSQPGADHVKLCACFSKLGEQLAFDAEDNHFARMMGRQDPRALELAGDFLGAMLESRPAVPESAVAQAIGHYMDHMWDAWDADIPPQAETKGGAPGADDAPWSASWRQRVQRAVEDLMGVGAHLSESYPAERTQLIETTWALLSMVYLLPPSSLHPLMQNLFRGRDPSLPMALALRSLEVARHSMMESRYLSAGEVNHFHKWWMTGMVAEALACPDVQPQQLLGLVGGVLKKLEGYTKGKGRLRAFDALHGMALQCGFEPCLQGRLQAVLAALSSPVGDDRKQSQGRPWVIPPAATDKTDPAGARRRHMAFDFTRAQLAGVGAAQALSSAIPSPTVSLGLDDDPQDMEDRRWALTLEALSLPGALTTPMRQQLLQQVCEGGGLSAQRRVELAEVLLSCPQTALQLEDYPKLRAALLDLLAKLAAADGAGAGPAPHSKDEKATPAPMAGRSVARAQSFRVDRPLVLLELLYQSLLVDAGLRRSSTGFDATATLATRRNAVEVALVLAGDERRAIEQQIAAGGLQEVEVAARRHALTVLGGIRGILADALASVKA